MWIRIPNTGQKVFKNILICSEFLNYMICICGVPEGDDGLEAGEDAGLLLHLSHGCLVNLLP